MSLAAITGNSEATRTDDSIDKNGNSAGALQNEFLTLMVAQIRNQDPLNPLDGAEYVAQLAQFSTVEGVENMARMQQQNNIKLDTMQVLQSTQLVGKQVSVPASEIQLQDMQSLSGTVELEAGASDVRVWALGPDGKVAGEVKLGAQSAGSVTFDLPPLAEGRYTLQAVIARGDEITTRDPYLHRTVEKVSVPPQGGDVRLQVEGLGSLSLFSVNEFLGAQS